nr:MAG TPA: hypothetical protein [Microviridae sp.]
MTEWCFYCFYLPRGKETDYLYVGFEKMPSAKMLMRIQHFLIAERYRAASMSETYKLWNIKIPSILWPDLRFLMSYHPTAFNLELPFVDENKAIELLEAPY